MQWFYLTLLILLFPLPSLAQTDPSNAAIANPMALDPFTAPAKPAATPAPVAKKPVAAPAPLPRAQPVPAGLRALLISDTGVGVLSAADGVSIPVVHGKSVRVGDQDYYVEITETEIKLWSSAKGRLVWAGALAGAVLLSEPADASQLKYTPPLSAGVSPGLSSSGAGNAPVSGSP
jgi:hypothetical protein